MSTTLAIDCGGGGIKGSVLDSAALDKYSFTRDVFLQVRSQAGEAQKGDDAGDKDANDGVLPEEPPR